MKNKPDKLPVRVPSWLRWLLGTVLIMGLVWLGLRLIVLALPTLPNLWAVGLLGGTAVLGLIVAVVAAGLIMRRRQRRVPRRLSITAVLVLACLLPFLLFLFPALLQTDPVSRETGHTWYLLWQMLMLAGVQAVRIAPPLTNLEQTDADQPAADRTADKPRKTGWQWSTFGGLLAGLGLWLVSAFLTSLLNNGQANLLTFWQQPLLFRFLLPLSAVAAAPWAEERFYRGILQRKLQQPFTLPEPPRFLCFLRVPAAFMPLSPLAANIAVAGLYALLQFNLYMMLPAFLLSLVSSELIRRTRRLGPSVVAHTLFNVLALLLDWRIVL